MAYHMAVNFSSDHTPHFAIHCQYLRRTIEPGRVERFVTLCTHPVRDGADCIGPFLEDLTTECRLWEPHPQATSIPLPQPERWQRRRRREGYDLIHELRVGLAQAALGTSLTLETLDGDEELTVPPGTPHGKEIRLRQRGVPHLEGRGRGDLRVVVTVEVPSKLTEAEDDLLRRYAEARGEAVSPPDKGLLKRIRSAFS